MTLLFRKDEPIIRSALETDVYKILMLYYIWRYYPYLRVRWAFKNRTVKVPLSTYVSVAELREHLQAVQQLRFTGDDIAYLKLWEMFDPDFPDALGKLRLPLPTIREEGGQLAIEIEGTWMETTLWEIYILPIVAELYARGRAKADGITEQALYDEGLRRTGEKVAFLKRHPELKLALFGLRRRASGPWEELVTETFLSQTTNIVGVSNVYLAKKFGEEPVGTNAHELAMAEYAVARHMSEQRVRQSPYEVLRKWEHIYGHKARIMLSDTFGTDAFLKNLPPDIAHEWIGHRQDSGDPFVIGEKIVADYKGRGIDSQKKRILFTDGLDVRKMLELYEHFSSEIQVGFGVGTNFTNDLGHMEPLSIVMKLLEAAGNPTVKLSDNLAKAMGPEEEVKVAKEIFGYTNTYREATVY